MQNHIVLWLLSPFLLLLVAGFYLAIIPVAQAFAPELAGGLAYFYAVTLTILMMPLSPFGIAIAFNIGTGILVGASLLRTFFGLETAFSMAGEAAANSTFIAIICGLTYLCMDPAMKAAYVLRCFYGRSLHSGEDLRIALRRAARAAAPLLLLAAGLFYAIPAAAEAPDENVVTLPSASVDTGELNRALDSELGKWRYTWRMPREALKPGDEGVILRTIRSIAESIENAFTKLRDAFKRFLDWLFPEHRPEPGGALPQIDAFRTMAQFALALLIVLLIGALGLLAYRVWKSRRRLEAQLMSLGIARLPDIKDENTVADQLPEHGWLAMARSLLDQGEFRLATRALFLAILAKLAHGELLRIARFKSNNEYAHELARHAHVHPGLLSDFREGAYAFEAVWYGEHEATRETFERLLECHNRLPGASSGDEGARAA